MGAGAKALMTKRSAIPMMVVLTRVEEVGLRTTSGQHTFECGDFVKLRSGAKP